MENHLTITAVVLIAGVTAMFVSVMLSSLVFTVQTAEIAIITRFGKFLRIAEAGLNFKVPFIDTVAGRVSLRVQQAALRMETKTSDNVFVTIPIAVQYRVKPGNAFDAFYKLAEPIRQIEAYVEQVILGHVPGLTLDQVFANQSSIAAAVKKELAVDMESFGYEIVNVLVTDIAPDAKVKAAMNDINAAQREQVAATARGEAEKILVVKKAEAEAEAKALQGQGIAKERAAIVEGLRESVSKFKDALEDVGTSDVMHLLLVTQYFDTLKSIGSSGKSSTIFLPAGAGAVSEMRQQMLEAFAASKPDA
jgi:regulator of protease activity HflC (stomatin/prohibitin superfamily)